MNLKHWRVVGLLILTSCLGACASFQEKNYLQEYGSQGGRGQGFRSRPYQVDKEVHTCVPGKISGRITRLRVESFAPGSDQLLAAEVQTPNQGLVHVHLGPVGLLDIHESDLKPGDEVTIQAYCYNVAGRELLLASEVVHKDNILQLRDPQGNPLREVWPQN